MAYFIWPWCLPGGYSAQAIKGCIDYKLKSADNLYVLTNVCKLLSLTYYIIHSGYTIKYSKQNIENLAYENLLSILGGHN